MPIPAALAGALSNQGAQIAETAVQGLGTLLGGLDAIINPAETVPPMIGMASSDFMQMGLAAIMSSTNTNLQYAKSQAVERGYDLTKEIEEAEGTRQYLVSKFGAKAKANAIDTVNTKPTKAEVEEFHAACRRLIAVQNTQRVQLGLYRKYVELNDANFDFKALLRKIIKGAGTVFKYVDKAKGIYDKAKPYLDKI